MHQCFIKCEACGEEGYTQTKDEPKYCPVCGSPALDVDLIEFEILEAGAKPKPKPKPPKKKPKKPRVQREETVNQKPPRKKPEYARKQTGPKPGVGFIRVDSLYTEHTRPETIEIVEVEYRKNPLGKKRSLRPYLILNCGFKAVNNYVPYHMHRIHGVPLEEAKEMCKMENVHKLMAAKGKTEYRTVYVEIEPAS